MRFTTDGLIIREQQVGESDRLITVLSQDKGIFKAFASGAMQFKRKNAGTQLLSYSHLSVIKRKDTYRIEEATVNELFFSLREDIEALSLASYFCELCECLAPREDNARDYLRLMLNSLALLSEKKRPKLLIKAVLELRITSVSGYMPDLGSCSGCGKTEDDVMFLDPVNGKIYCSDCKKAGTLIPMPKGILSAARHIIYSDFEKIFNFSLPDGSLKLLSQVSEKYTEAQLERSFKTLKFYKSLFPEGI